MSRPAYVPAACGPFAYPGEADPGAAGLQDLVPAVAYPQAAYRLAPQPRPARRTRRGSPLPALAALVALTVAGWVMLTHPDGTDPVPPAGVSAPATASLAERGPPSAPRQDLSRQDLSRQDLSRQDLSRQDLSRQDLSPPQKNPSPRPDIAWMLDPAPALGAGATAFGDEAPPASAFRLAAAPAPAGLSPALRESPAIREIARTLADTKPEPVRIAEAAPAALVPLPVSRPPELRRTLPAPAQRVAARPLPRTRDVFRAAMAPEPSFLDKLFGTGAPAEAPPQALAYADPDALPQARPRARISPSPEASPAAGTAVYDISARTVTLPSGEVLEAHSGLGQAMDDPRYVHLRMRGSTPPGTYDLTERERLFHGVRAIRLNPMGGSGAIHGRDGLLAHTYMLRQPGASNGCVAFRNYDRFLQAFLRGEIRRLVVVAGGSGDFLGGRRLGSSERAGGGA